MHKALKEFSLSSRDCAPSPKLTHQAPFIIICKGTKHTKNKNTLDAIFLASLNHHVVTSLAELGFVTFIHRKHLTLFLGYITLFSYSFAYPAIFFDSFVFIWIVTITCLDVKT
jgi:hypothetical protein